MKLIIDAPENRMVEAAILFKHHCQTGGESKIGQRNARHYGQTFGGVYKTTWAVWATKNGFSMRYLGDEK